MAARLQHRLSSTGTANPANTASHTANTANTASLAAFDDAQQALRLARQSLSEAALSADPARRYASAHVAALRATAALLAIRARPSRRSTQRNAWELLTAVAPELTDWAVLFASGARKRAAAEAGLSHAVTEREADDQLRDAERFLSVVEKAIGTPVQLSLDCRARRWAPARRPRAI